MDSTDHLMQSAGDLLGRWGPAVAGALALLLATAAVAWLARRAVERGVAASGIERRLTAPGLARTLGGVAAGIVWLLGLPGILSALGMTALLGPVQAMLGKLLAFLPNLVGAGLILAIGVIVAGIVRQLVSGLLRAAGSEKLAERLGLAVSLGEGGLSGVVGTVVFVLVLLPTVAAALQPLQLDALSVPVTRLVDSVMQLIPRLIVGALIVALGALVGRALAGIVTGLLRGLGFDALPRQIGWTDRAAGGRTASEWAGQALMVGVVFVCVVQACEIVGVAVLTEAVSQLGAALLRVATGAVLLVLGLWLAARAASAVVASGVHQAAALAMAARVAVLVFAAALAMRQMGLPAEIVVIAFGALCGAFAVAFALAVGLGGRRIAARLLERGAEAFLAAPAPAPAPQHAPQHAPPYAPAPLAEAPPGRAARAAPPPP